MPDLVAPGVGLRRVLLEDTLNWDLNRKDLNLGVPLSKLVSEFRYNLELLLIKWSTSRRQKSSANLGFHSAHLSRARHQEHKGSGSQKFEVKSVLTSPSSSQ